MAEELTAPNSLESALTELEQLLQQMEQGELPLDELVGKYEAGVRLVAYCQEQLEASGKKIELLTRHLDGTFSTAPFLPEDA
jgi:exodeoxyribonuclease VII small subunit